MKRAVFLFLLLAPFVSAQGVEGLLDDALKASAKQSDRLQLLKQAMAREGGPAEVARRGLDLNLDSEVVHAVVEVLMDSGNAPEHIQRIAQLLLDDEHRKKVEQRIQRYSEDQQKARELLDPLGELALGEGAASSSNPKLRRAGIRALSKIPLRDAIEKIVEAWEKDTDATVRDECRQATADSLGVSTHQDAAKILRGSATFYDLVMALSRRRKRESQDIEEWVRLALENAKPEIAFEKLAHRSPMVQAIASARISRLAEEGKFGKMGAEAFARAAFGHFVKASAQDPKTIANLCDTLAQPTLELLKWVKPADALPPLKRLSSGESQDVGRACLALLDVLGDDGIATLADFAREFRSVAIRRKAIQILGGRAQQDDTYETRIGLVLASLLAAEKDVGVRKQLLFTMKEAPVEKAHEPVKALLPELKGEELAYAIEILRRIDSAIDTLIEEAKTHAEPGVRLTIVRDGLIARAADGKDAPRIYGFIKGLVVAPRSALKFREEVLGALGARGGLDAHEVLGELARTDGLDQQLTAAAKEARLDLAERFVAKQEFVTTRLVLFQEHGHARVAAIVQKIRKAAGDRPTGWTRYLLAKIEEEARGGNFLNLYREAAAWAARDKLLPEGETQLLLHLRTLLQGADPPSRENLEGVIRWSKRLVDLDKDNAKDHWLTAAACALRLKDRAQVEQYLSNAKEAGAPDTGEYAKIVKGLADLPGS